MTAFSFLWRNKIMTDSLMPNYKRLPVAFTRGAGAWLWDTDDNRYLDAVTGIAVCGLGHAHPALQKALSEQAATLIHTSNLYRIPLQEQLAARLTSLSGMETAFFCNSGAEANEAALKLARLHGHNKGIDTPVVVVANGSFHGRTMGALSATGNPKIQHGFEPLLPGFLTVPYDDIAAIEALDDINIVAVLIEPVQGEGGVNVPAPGYLKALRDMCDQRGWLLMLDEVQTGIARTGAWFAFQHEDIVPDVVCLAKGLGNGVPIGACLARGDAAQVFQPGTHGSTFGGNPLACRAALAVLEIIENDNLLARVNFLSKRLYDGFQTEVGGLTGVVDIRHAGLLFGIELDRACGALVSEALNNGILINVTADKVIRLLPPFVLNDADADHLVTTISQLIREFLSVE